MKFRGEKNLMRFMGLAHVLLLYNGFFMRIRGRILG